MMRIDLSTKLLLGAIAVFLGVLAFRPFLVPASVQAQAGAPYFIEPGYTLLRNADGTRQVLGKVVVNLETGDIWGFPTGQKAPFPVDPTRDTPPVSSPMYLGRFDFSAMRK
jgi:hypothetical protein